MRPGIFVSRTREKLGRTCDQIGRTLDALCITFGKDLEMRYYKSLKWITELSTQRMKDRRTMLPLQMAMLSGGP